MTITFSCHELDQHGLLLRALKMTNRFIDPSRFETLPPPNLTEAPLFDSILSAYAVGAAIPAPFDKGVPHYLLTNSITLNATQAWALGIRVNLVDPEPEPTGA